MPKEKAVRRALRAAFESWLWRAPPDESALERRRAARPSVSPRVVTESSVTVFGGEPSEWVGYLALSLERRYERGLVVEVHRRAEAEALAFVGRNADSTRLAGLLDTGFRRLLTILDPKPHVVAALHDLVFARSRGGDNTVHVRVSRSVPGRGTLEATREENGSATSPPRIVLRADVLREVEERLEAGAGTLSLEEQLGAAWPLLERVIFGLAFPRGARDLFAARIDVEAQLAYVAVNALYERRKAGALVPNAGGALYERWLAESSAIPGAELMDRHPYCRMLLKLDFLLRAGPYAGYREDARVAAREYLDTSYLRLNLAGAMPAIAPGFQPLDPSLVASGAKASVPAIGSHGVLDEEDREAWRKVAGPLGDLGFLPLRQLGIGEFGRVYEVLNDHNPALPARVALKVDRIVGKKKKAILEAEEALRVGHALARSPHVIRLYDSGKLASKKFTYHVLQLIDGDTLDNLIGVTGREHASVSRPPRARRSEHEAHEEYERAVSSRGSELWRRDRAAAPFAHALSAGMVLDLLTSVLLWLEEVHQAGYAINDLKNGNLMMNRRGQLKGIDLDSYARIHSPKDKITDFMFLAVSLVLVLLNAPVVDRGRHLAWEELIESEAKLRSGLADAWPFGDVAALSDGRVTKEEMMDVLVDLVQRSRRLAYTKQPDLYSEDVGRLIRLKQRLLVEELVID